MMRGWLLKIKTLLRTLPWKSEILCTCMSKSRYKRIIKLSSTSYLENDELSDPHVDFSDLLDDNTGVAVFSGTIFGLFGELYNKGKFSEVLDLYKKLLVRL